MTANSFNCPKKEQRNSYIALHDMASQDLYRGELRRN